LQHTISVQVRQSFPPKLLDFLELNVWLQPRVEFERLRCGRCGAAKLYSLYRRNWA